MKHLKIISIPNYRAPSRNQTATSHWRKHQEHRNEMAEMVRTYVGERFIISPAVVVIEAYYKGKRGVDASNIDDKHIVDALMKVGILKDDDPTENPEVTKRSYVNMAVDRLDIFVKSI